MFPRPDNALAFHAFRIAVSRFRQTPDRLDADQHARLLPLAEKACALEKLALVTPQAKAVVPSEAEIDERVRDAENAHGGKVALAALLAANGLDRVAFVAGIARELRFDDVMRRVGAVAALPTPQDVRAFFDRQAERFRIPEKRSVRHILITINPDFPENHHEAAARRIGDLARQLQGEPTLFEALARAHSECPTALQGGLVGTVPRGILYPEIEAAAFSLPVGRIAGPLETAVGFHLVCCDAIYPERRKAFAEAAPKIREHLEKAARTAAQRQWLAALRPSPFLMNGP